MTTPVASLEAFLKKVSSHARLKDLKQETNPSSFLFLVEMPFAPSSIPVPSSKARSP